MKAFILSGLIAATLVILPVSGMATNPLLHFDSTQLTSQTGSCGETSDPNFCSCFTTAMIDGCNKQVPHPRCDIPHIKSSITTYGVQWVCQHYSPVSQDECVTDINYWMSNCGI